MTMPIFYGVCGAVAESDQVALIPRQLAHSLGPKLGLSVYEPPMKMELPLICMVWHKRVTNAPAHRWLRGVIADILCPLNQGERTLPLVAAQ